MSELRGEQVLVRIYIGESDKAGSKPLYQSLVELLRREKNSRSYRITGNNGFWSQKYPPYG